MIIIILNHFLFTIYYFCLAVFGIFGSELVARSGDGSESILLIDDNGYVDMVKLILIWCCLFAVWQTWKWFEVFSVVKKFHSIWYQLIVIDDIRKLLLKFGRKNIIYKIWLSSKLQIRDQIRDQIRLDLGMHTGKFQVSSWFFI